MSGRRPHANRGDSGQRSPRTSPRQDGLQERSRSTHPLFHNTHHTVPLTPVAAFGSQILAQLLPLLHTWHVPAIGANALHSAGVRVAGGIAVHHGRPIVQPSVTGSQTLHTERRIAVGLVVVSYIANRDCGPVGIARSAQVLPHPALLPNFY